ncbi:hypothetical protein [Vibrio diazotrophicus]|uniref:Uncharacterized protein n=1 Tax=Vibrio diazotrophicus TaxID=685 RepID=A0ABX4W6M5_VIBDI|nr:hypothetical protein [Vibrio diazotrophicus]PNH99250.1 hypothetical protein C1O25_18020 [Vibrio diazotrophicus]
MSSKVVFLDKLIEKVERAINMTGDFDNGLYPVSQEDVRSTLLECHQYMRIQFERQAAIKPKM